MDYLMKNPYELLNRQGFPMKNEVLINTGGLPQELGQWVPQNQDNSYSLNQCKKQWNKIVASLFFDTKFVPFDQQVIHQQEDVKLQTAKFNPPPVQGVLPSNSMQLSLDQFKGPNAKGQLPPQNLPNTFIAGTPPPIATQGIDPIQSQLIQQYEQVMQLMHQEIQRLLVQNKDLQEQQSQQQTATNRSFYHQQQQDTLQLQLLTKEKEELLESLRQREHLILQLRTDLEQSDHAPQKGQRDQERLKRMERQLREQEQQVFDLEQQNRNLKRDLKHQSLINEQLRQEIEEINQKREDADLKLQEAKNKISQALIQMRQLQTVIDSQQLEITNLANQKTHYEKFADQATFESEKLRDQLQEADLSKLQQVQLLERKEREIQNLRTVVRRFLTVIQTHRQEFGDLADCNYDMLFKDVSNINIQFTPAQVQLSHTAYQHQKQVKFDAELPPAQKTKNMRQNQENNMDDYYSMVEQLTQYVRDQNGSSRHRSPQRSGSNLQDSMIDNRQPKSILKNSSYGNLQEEPSAQPAISWVSQAQTTQAPPQRKKSPEKGKGINVEGLKNTLASLIEERNTLERQIKSGGLKPQDELKFELELANNNIKRIQEKLQAAGAN